MIMSIMPIIKYILRFWHGEMKWYKMSIGQKHPIEPAKIVFFSREKFIMREKANSSRKNKKISNERIETERVYTSDRIYTR